MTRQAGGIGAAIRSSYQQGRYDERQEVAKILDVLLEMSKTTNDMLKEVTAVLREHDDQISQNKIVLTAIAQAGILDLLRDDEL